MAEERRTKAFAGFVVNKVDRKGRVSVPAAFRANLDQLSLKGVFVHPSLDGQALVGAGDDYLERQRARIEALPQDSVERGTLETAIFTMGVALDFDGEGRVQMPRDKLDAVGISEQAAFLGRGETFLVMAPDAARAMIDADARIARERRGALWRQPGGGT
ncbi:MAG: hypothetical protein FJX46_08905 [Alphaproteobacteria bacterium]|nr:hypothetical protein [Alphaproteobacteria bacterium]